MKTYAFFILSNPFVKVKQQEIKNDCLKANCLTFSRKKWEIVFLNHFSKYFVQNRFKLFPMRIYWPIKMN